MTLLKIVLTLLLLSGCNHPESKDYERNKGFLKSTSFNNEITKNEVGYKVIGVKDGDTFVLLIDGKEKVVRLAHIDCPEKGQPFGSKAKLYVSDLCFGKYITLIHKNKYDRNKRLVSEIILGDGTNLNKELVKNGLAWHFKKYSNDSEYAELETIARQERVGLWYDNGPIAPWEWRK